MASGMPIPRVRGPTPSPEASPEQDTDGLGLMGMLEPTASRGSRLSTYSTYSVESNLSLGEPMHGRSPSITSLSPSISSSLRNPGSISNTSLLSPETFQDPNLTNEERQDPFNFQTQTYTLGKSPVLRSSVGQRRGHKYKHSSVSHQIFLEPPPRAPLRLPASLPIPTIKEGWKSMSREQALRLSWCFCHLSVAAWVQWTAQGSLSLTALSHLIFYDAIGAFLCAGVEVLSNFEVWKVSSIRQPFGLERSEVLVGFAISILLLFMGFDLISHNVAHFLDDLGGHGPHREHKHDRVSPGSVDLVSLLAIASTLISAVMLQNHSRMGKSMRFASISFLPSILSNPSHFLTLSCSAILLLMPLLSFEMYTWLDRTLSTTMALAMCGLGFQFVKALGAMLLMSYSGPGIPALLRQIEVDPSVSAVEEAKFWQVHYGLCMANIKLRVRGTEDSLAKLRERVSSLVKNRLGGGYGTGGSGQNWEVSTQLILETD